MMKSEILAVGRYAKLESKYLESHLDVCNFTLRKL